MELATKKIVITKVKSTPLKTCKTRNCCKTSAPRLSLQREGNFHNAVSIL